MTHDSLADTVRRAILGTLLVLTAAPSAAQAPPEPVQVDAKKKPADAWTAYPTRAIEQVAGFEQSSVDPPRTRFGGAPGQKLEATGFFHPHRIGDRWWLIDPEGFRFLNVGVVSVAPGKSPNSQAAFTRAFGTPATWAADITGLLRARGFNGTGAWSDTSTLAGSPTRVPYTLMWNFMSAYGKQRGGTSQQPGHTGYPNDCIFVFDPEFEAFADQYARQLAATRDDPWLIGHFSDNELPFRADALDRYLALPAEEAGRKAADRFIAARRPGNAALTDTDRQEFLRMLVDRYFTVTTAAIRKYDPNHLCLGSRFHGGVLNLLPLFEAAGRHLDVVSVNYYNAWTPDLARMRGWERSAAKPILVTEWYTKAMDSGMPNTTGAGWIVKTQRDRGLFYQNFALALLESKVCVGWHWFKYMDNDPDDLSTDPSNRDSNKGIVSFRYEHYTPLLDLMQALNVRVYSLAAHFDR